MSNHCLGLYCEESDLGSTCECACPVCMLAKYGGITRAAPARAANHDCRCECTKCCLYDDAYGDGVLATEAKLMPKIAELEKKIHRVQHKYNVALNMVCGGLDKDRKKTNKVIESIIEGCPECEGFTNEE